jgi:DNA polymerase III gamma/tau subunit
VTKLTDIETLVVSLVQRGANRKKFGVKKSNEQGEQDMATVAQLIAQVITKGELPVDDAAFAEKVKQVGLTDPQAIEAAKALVKIAAAYQDMGAFGKFVSEVLPGLIGQATGAPDADASTEPDPKDPGEKKEPNEQPAPGKDKPVDTPSAGSKEPAPGNTQQPPADKPPEKKEPPMSKDDKTQAGNGNGATTDVAKQASDEKVAQLETLMKSQQEAFTATIAKLEKQAKERDEAQLLKDWVTKAKDELKFVPGKSADELGKMLFDAETKVSKEAAELQFGVLKASSLALAKSALFQPSGSQPHGSASAAGGNDAMSRINKSATVMLEKSDILKTELPGMVGVQSIVKSEMQKAMSVAKALEFDPELYADYLREHPQQSGSRYSG